MLRRSAALALAAGALALPSVASAGTLTADRACYGTDQSPTLSGTGFTPIYGLALLGGVTDASAYPDSDGSFDDGFVGLPANNTFTPRAVTIRTEGPDPSLDTSITLLTVRSGSNLPVRGKPGATVAWRFGNFPSGAPIYGHYRYGYNGPFRTVRDVRFGTATGPCGVLTKQAKRVPVKNPQRRGEWYLQIDTKPRYSSRTQLEYDITFSIR